VLLVDTFTDVFAPDVAVAAARVLRRAGHEVAVVADVCCGRPRYAEGMLDRARRDAHRLVERLGGTGDVPVVWLEPSCLSVVRDELPDLQDDAAARAVAARSRSLAELVVEEGWELPVLPPEERDVVLHPHCHHRASIGTTAEAQVLDALAADWRDLDAGCCGLAGAFGFVAGDRHAVSVAAAEDRFAPRLRDLPPGTTSLMDGFSCREQAAHLDLPVRPRHLAELLDRAMATTDQG
jgi:Fe-S oxidoreductase